MVVYTCNHNTQKTGGLLKVQASLGYSVRFCLLPTPPENRKKKKRNIEKVNNLHNLSKVISQ